MKTLAKLLAALLGVNLDRCKAGELEAIEAAQDFSDEIARRVSAMLESVTTPRFVSFTYTDKKAGETSRRVLLVGQSYLGLLEAAQLAVTLAKPEDFPEIDGETFAQAKAEELASLEERIAKNKQGEQSANYTKAGLYVSICPGVKMHKLDGSFELCGVEHSKVVLTPGNYRKVNSSPVTIAKNKLRKLSRLGKFKTLCLDFGNAQAIKFNGETVEFN